MPNYIEIKEIGPLSYCIEKNGKEYRLWLNGCRIGRPHPGKPAHEIWEYHAKSLREALDTIAIDGKERIFAMIEKLSTQLDKLQEAIGECICHAGSVCGPVCKVRHHSGCSRETYRDGTNPTKS